jgi:hypothetical protein
MKASAVLAGIAAGLLCATAALAHHSFAAFDRTQTITMSGTVKDWQWTNPHTWLTLVIKTPGGAEEEWGIEGQSPEVMRRQGVARDVMKAGDKVTVTVHPRHDASKGGSLVSVVEVNGHELASKGQQ